MNEPEFRLGDFNLNKNAYSMTISREMALIHGLVEPTPEEAEAMAKAAAEGEGRRREAWRLFDESTAKLAAIDDELVRSLLDLHTPLGDFGKTCDGCDFGGCEGEPPEWPCRTIQHIATIHDIELPNAWDLWGKPPE